MDPTITAIIARALDGLSTRSAFIAQNIANANSETYRPVRVEFEDNLRAAAERGHDAIGQAGIDVIEAPEPNEVRLDLELAESATTAMRYRALIDILSRQMALHRAAAGAR